MIVAIIVVLLLLSAMSDWADAKDWEASERNAEIRHQEMLEAYEKKTRKNRNTVNKATRTRAIKDASGRTLVEEVIIEGEFDYED